MSTGRVTRTMASSAPSRWVGFAVDSFRVAHDALATAGIDFLYPDPQRSGGRAWQHFRAPDGNVYEIIGPDDIDATA